MTEILSKAVLDALPSHLVVVNASGDIIEVNEAWSTFARNNGASNALISGIGLSYLEACHKSGRYQNGDAIAACRGIESVLEGTSASFSMEYTCHSSEEKRWFVLTVLPIQNGQGGAVVSHFDITDRKWAEMRGARFDQIFERSRNEIFIFDADTLLFIEVNEGARNNLGYSLEELRSLTPVDIKPHYDVQAFKELIGTLVSKQKSKIEFHSVHQRKDGSRYPVEIHLQMMQFDDRPVFVAIVLDITERTVSAEALAQARLFLESAPDAMLIVGTQGTIDIANTQAEKLFGYTRNEFSEMSVDGLVPERFRDTHVSHRAKFFDSPRVRGMGSDLDLFGVTKDGREIPIEVSLSPIKTAEGMLVAAAIRDVTQRREDARVLEAAKEAAESATLIKTRFLAAASHDLRQPLQSIGLYLSTLTRLLDQPKPIAISEKIRGSLTVMHDILEALLDVSKLESGAISPARKEFSVQTLFDKLQADAEPHATEKDLSLEFKNTDCIVNSDPALLLRIVENFVTNAIRYTKSGRVIIRCRCEDGSAWIDVEDSGIGIPEDVVEAIFEEYFQVENDVRDRNKGLGLGLSIVKYIATLLNHPLKVQSSVGEGSIFSVNVPMGKDKTDAVSLEGNGATVTKRNKQPKVLFVDDDPAILDGIKELFELIDMELYCAGCGNEALDHINNGVTPDILISDFRLPDYNGVEVVQRVRKTTREDLPAVILTGDTSGRELEKANLSNYKIFHKPVDIDELVAHIERVTA